jgi:methionine-rich copper-binding protein CopC
MKNLLLMLLSIALFSGGSAYAADAKLVKSTPADGGVSDTPPSAFVLEFSQAVQVHQIFIKKDDGKSKPLGKLPSKEAATVTIPAPSLTAGHYVLEWSVFSDRSRVLSGRIRFTVSGESVAAPSSTQ